jgi:hypothetical protein
MLVLESTKLNQEVFKNIQITSQENMIIKSLEKFYEDNYNIELFISIINSQSKISIRLIDHFVTKYSKTNKINYKLKENDVEQIFNVHTSYKQQLKAFQKKHFDPFSRGDRIPYFMNDICIITTIGQLNFFRWFISKKIYDYILTNHDLIEYDMNKNNKIENNKKNKTIKESQKNKFSKTNISVMSSKLLNNNYRTLSKPLILNNNYKTSTNTLNFGESKTEKIVVSFTFN